MWEKETLDPTLNEKIAALAKNGLKVYLCAYTFERNHVPKEKARDGAFIAFVPSGIATAGALQEQGVRLPQGRLTTWHARASRGGRCCAVRRWRRRCSARRTSPRRASRAW